TNVKGGAVTWLCNMLCSCRTVGCEYFTPDNQQGVPMTTLDRSQMQKEALLFLEETFETHHGIYIDKGTTLLDTLSDLTAAKASLRASPQTASVAAHVRHTVFYMQVLQQALRGKEVGKVNWREVWE